MVAPVVDQLHSMEPGTEQAILGASHRLKVIMVAQILVVARSAKPAVVVVVQQLPEVMEPLQQ
jgi:hypothetical protein